MPRRGTCRSFFITMTKESGPSSWNTCGRSIPMKARMVAIRNFCFFILVDFVFISLMYTGRRRAVRLSPSCGNDFLMPVRTWDRNGVLYSSGSQPWLRKRYFTCVSYPKIVADADIVGFSTKEAIKNAKRSSVAEIGVRLKGYTAAEGGICCRNRLYAFCPVLYVFCEDTFNAAS